MVHEPSVLVADTSNSPWPRGPRIGISKSADPLPALFEMLPEIIPFAITGLPSLAVTQGDACARDKAIEYASEDRNALSSTRNREPAKMASTTRQIANTVAI
jgi:hypothetical protein